MTNRFFVILTATTFFTSQVLAQNMAGFMGARGGAEYWVGKEEGKPLIVVNLISGVSQPGIYHIPVDTNIAQLIAYAGGSERNSVLSEIQIRRQRQKDQIEFIEYNFEKLARGNSPMPQLADKDVVTIPVSWNIERTAQYIAIIAGITAILLSVNTLEKTYRTSP